MINKKEYIWKILIVVLFVILITCLHYYHEPWADEAQSFLLARDTSLLEMFHYMKYEGTPPLWVIVIKVFFMLGGTYSTFWLIPLIFSTIAIIILEFKIELPWYIKVLLPFTYYICCQYTIVIRNYSMLFLALMIIAYIYPKRMEKTKSFSLALFFLMTISTHTFLIAGSLFLLYIIDLIRLKKIKEIKYISSVAFISLFFIITIFVLIPTSDGHFHGNGGWTVKHILSESMLCSNDNLVTNIFSITVILVILLKSMKDENIAEIIMLFVPIMILLSRMHCMDWHVGIIFYLFLFYLIISNLINTKTYIKVLFTMICIVQIVWTVGFCWYDINYPYSAGKKMANFIKSNELEQRRIIGLGYNVTAIQPYFEKNIFENQYESNKAFWNWGNSATAETKKIDRIVEANADVYIICEFYSDMYADVITKLENMDYKRVDIKGFTFSKTHLCESGTYYVFLKNEINLKEYK